jgi:hypothetical protein
MKISKAQRVALTVIGWAGEDGYADQGWAEANLQLSCQLKVPDQLVWSTCDRIFDALQRKGLIRDEGGPVLTETGRALISSQSSTPV